MQALDLFGGREVVFEKYKSYLRWLLKDVPVRNIGQIETNNQMDSGALYGFIIGKSDLKVEAIKGLCRNFCIYPREVLRNPAYTSEPPNRKEDWVNHFKENPLRIRFNGNRDLELICDIDEAVGFQACIETFGQIESIKTKPTTK